MAERTTLYTQERAGGAQQYTSPRMQAGRGERYNRRQTMEKLILKRAERIGGTRGAAFEKYARAALDQASADTVGSFDVEAMYERFKRKEAKLGAKVMKKRPAK